MKTVFLSAVFVLVAALGCRQGDPPPDPPDLEPIALQAITRAAETVESWPAAERLGQALAAATYWRDWDLAAQLTLEASVCEAELNGRDYNTVRHAARLAAAMAAWQKATQRKPVLPPPEAG